MKNHDTIEREVEKRYRQKEKRKRKRMGVSGKSVFRLQNLITANAPKKLLTIKKKRKKS